MALARICRFSVNLFTVIINCRRDCIRCATVYVNTRKLYRINQNVYFTRSYEIHVLFYVIRRIKSLETSYCRYTINLTYNKRIRGTYTYYARKLLDLGAFSDLDAKKTTSFLFDSTGGQWKNNYGIATRKWFFCFFPFVKSHEAKASAASIESTPACWEIRSKTMRTRDEF